MEHKRPIKIEIQNLQEVLGKEYEKCMDKGITDDYIIKMSQRLDALINNFLEIERCQEK